MGFKFSERWLQNILYMGFKFSERWLQNILYIYYTLAYYTLSSNDKCSLIVCMQVKTRKGFSEKKHSCGLIFLELIYIHFHLLNTKHLNYYGNIQIIVFICVKRVCILNLNVHLCFVLEIYTPPK